MKSINALTATLAFTVFLAGYVAPMESMADSHPLTIDEIKALNKAGIGDDVIISQIKATHAIYHLTATRIIELKKEGISQTVIHFMVNTVGDLASNGTATTPAPSTPKTNQTSTETVTVTPALSSATVAVAPTVTYYVAPYPAAPYPVVEYYPPFFPFFGPYWWYGGGRGYGGHDGHGGGGGHSGGGHGH